MSSPDDHGSARIMKLPRFTLRDLFWLTLVAGCLCGWWMERQRHYRQERELDRLLKEGFYRTESERDKIHRLRVYLASRGYSLEWTEDGNPVVEYMNANTSDLFEAIRDAGFKARPAGGNKIKLIPLDVPD